MKNEGYTPKLGLSTSCLFPFGVKSTFQAARELGYDGVEVMITGDKKSRDLEYLKLLQDKFQTPILSIHAPTLIATHFVWGTDAELKLRRTVELAKELQAETVVVHPPFTYQQTYAEGFIPHANNLQEELGVNVAIENMFPWTVKKRSREMYAPSWNTITTEASSLTFDFSHAALSGLDTLTTVKEYQQKIKHFHVCDGFGVKTKKRTGIEKNKLFDEHLLPGEGTQPILDVFKLLKENNWRGHLVAEVRTSSKLGLDSKFERLQKTLEYMKQYSDI
jgi:sugar phosphate isomerase/epimerase